MWIVHLNENLSNSMIFLLTLWEKSHTKLKSLRKQLVFLKVNSEKSLAAFVSIVLYSLLDKIKIAKYCEKFL